MYAAAYVRVPAPTSGDRPMLAGPVPHLWLLVSARRATPALAAGADYDPQGFLRIDNDEIDWMASNIQPGTPVDITG